MYQDDALLDRWVDGTIVVRYLAGEEHSVETISEQVLTKPTNILISDLEVHLSVVYLEGYSHLGIRVRRITQDRKLEDASLFLPWNAVLAITGDEGFEVIET